MKILLYNKMIRTGLKQLGDLQVKLIKKTVKDQELAGLVYCSVLYIGFPLSRLFFFFFFFQLDLFSQEPSVYILDFLIIHLGHLLF
jgi:hypothetical protein